MPPHLLLIEDNESLIRHLKRYLELLGFAVTATSNLSQAQAAIETSSIALVVTDVRLPGESGLDFLVRLRVDRPDVPVIVMSADASRANRQRALSLGAAAFVPKPFALAQFKQAVSEVLGRQGKDPDTNVMKMTNAKRFIAKFILPWGLFFAGGTLAQDQPGERPVATPAGAFSVSTGFDYTTGKYGGDAAVDEIDVPLTLRYSTENFIYKLTVPYLRVTAPTNVTRIDRGVVICDNRRGSGNGGGGSGSGGSGGGVDDTCPAASFTATTSAERTTQSGLGDVLAVITYEVPEIKPSGLLIDVTGKVKFGAADESKGLGTGKNAYTLQTDLSQPLGDFTLLGGVGYKWRQKPAGTTLRNSAFASLGGAYKFSGDTSVELLFDYRQPVADGATHGAELTTTIYHRISKDWRVSAYLLKGLTDASADWGAGILVTRHF